jgi:anti-anti-sigma factor
MKKMHRLGGKRMNINKNLDGNKLVVILEGRLDTTTAPQLEAELKASLNLVSELELNFAGLEYLSSAGLRVILAAQKVMNKQGKMVIKNVNSTIMEVFEVTGFVDILTIE